MPKLSPFAENLRNRVLHAAGFIGPVTSIPEKAVLYAESKVAELVENRTADPAACDAISAKIAKSFSKDIDAHKRHMSTDTAAKAAAHHPTAAATRNAASSRTPQPGKSHTSTPAAATPATPLPTSSLTPAPLSPSGNSHERTATTSPNRVRQLAEQRRQKASADKEWQSAVAAEVAAFEAAQEQERQRKLAIRLKMQQDMAMEQVYKDKAREEERRARQELREQVIAETAAVAQEEIDKKERLKRKFQAEKAAIEAQREMRRLAKETAKRLKVKQDAIQRQRLTQSIEEEQRQKHEFAVEVRDSLLSFLDESRGLLEEKRRRAAEQKKAEVQEDRANLSKLSALPQQQDDGLRMRTQASVQRQIVKQSLVEKLYLDIYAQKDAERIAEESRVKEAMKKEQEAVARRAAQDAEKAKRMRQQLVSALDTEIAIHETRKVEQEHSKQYYRSLAEKDAEAQIRIRTEEKEAHALRQRQLRERLATQLAEREALKSLPLQIKVTHGSPLRGNGTPSAARASPVEVGH